MNKGKLIVGASNMLEVGEKTKTRLPGWHRKMSIAATLMGCLAGSVAWALDAVKGPAVLEVSGQIEVRNQGTLAVFDLKALKALPQKSFTTHTPWDQKPVSFSGPLLRDVLQRVKAKGQFVQAVALNGHRLKLPVSAALEHDVVVAVLKNGQSIPVRSKGPLFIVSHFDAQKELKHKMPVERWMRQLKAIEVE
jgi:hypothetical protein